MQRAGCRGVDIGMESGDPEMLLRIGKGVTVERVLDVLRWARDLGLHCMLNLMFGWPAEALDELRATLDFIDLAALGRNFFHLPDAALELIQVGLRKKADYTYGKLF